MQDFTLLAGIAFAGGFLSAGFIFSAGYAIGFARGLLRQTGARRERDGWSWTPTFTDATPSGQRPRGVAA